MKIRKIYLLNLITILLLILSVNTSGNQADTTAPVFTAITLSQTNAVAGDIVLITVDATDAGSGVKRVELEIVPTEGDEIYFDMVYNGTLWVYSLEIMDYYRNTDFLVSVKIWDFLLNLSENYYVETITVSGTANPDSSDPVFHSYGVNASTAAAGDTVRYFADVTDDSEIIEVKCSPHTIRKYMPIYFQKDWNSIISY